MTPEQAIGLLPPLLGCAEDPVPPMTGLALMPWHVPAGPDGSKETQDVFVQKPLVLQAAAEAALTESHCSWQSAGGPAGPRAQLR